MSENVLLLCLSKVDFSHGLTKYKYDGLDEPVVGYMTNEAPAKVVLSMVDLDRIVVICSEDVLNGEIPKMDTQKEEDEIREYTLDDSEFPIETKEDFEKILELKYTHYDYYKTVITNYAKNHNRKIRDFYQVKISNHPEEFEVAQVAIKAANIIMGSSSNQTDVTEDVDFNTDAEKKDIHLYIDYNGGPRYIASMLLNIANLIEQNGAKIEDVFTMNFDNKIEINGEKYVAVENFMAVLQSARLVSGIKEYEDYGRCKELKKYFDNCGDEEITPIITNMEELSHCFQLCDTDKIFSKENDEEQTLPQVLRESLNNYVSKDDDLIEKGARSILFKYVAEDILNGYRPLFDGNLLDIIDWCIKNDYIQQAVTFYAERMPVYFWDNGIYYPTEDEESEYRQINDACNSIKEWLQSDRRTRNCSKLNHLNGRDEFHDMTDADLNYLEKEYLNYEWKYAWLVKYLEHSGIDRKGNDNFSWMRNVNLRYSQVKYWDLNSFWNEQRVRSEYVPDSDAQNFDRQKSKLHEILNDYWNIKRQRNAIDHADDNSQRSSRWDYETLCNKLKEGVRTIREFMKMD